MNIKELLETNDGTEKMIKKCIAAVEKFKGGVIIFGAGVGGKVCYGLLKMHGLEKKVIAYSDNNQMKFGLPYQRENCFIIPPNELIERYGTEIGVIIASSAYLEIKSQLLGYGLEEENIFLFNFAFMDLEYTDKTFIYDHLQDFQRAFDKMADEKSKHIYIDILNYKITKEEMFLKDMQQYVDNEQFQYFDKELFDFEKEECFLDLGAYIGDTLSRFDDIYGHKWERYYAFEADNKSFNILQKHVDDNNWTSKVETYNVAAWNKKEELYFEANAGSSTMEKNDSGKKEMIQGERIDNILSQEKVTFIKMDIEGSENMALIGMENLIKRNKPIIAVCVYHKRDDFFALTDLIEGYCPGDYAYFFRQYRYTPTETVCYAVPKERIIKRK